MRALARALVDLAITIEVGERLAYGEGMERPPLWTPGDFP